MTQRSSPSAPTRLLARTLVAGALGFAALVGAGCSILDRSEPSGSKYLLDPAAQKPVEGSVLGTATIARFSAFAPFDSRAFLYRTTDGSWRSDAYNGFLATPSDMLREAFARALERSGRFSLVEMEGVPIRCDFTIDGVIESFHADYATGGAPVAVVEVRAYLLDGRGSGLRVAAQMRGAGRANIEGDAPRDVAAALSAAAAEAIDAVIRALPASVAPATQAQPDAKSSLQPQKGATGAGVGGVAYSPR